jgi:predicted enzyme related to lactoylglutathione lyase
LKKIVVAMIASVGGLTVFAVHAQTVPADAAREVRPQLSMVRVYVRNMARTEHLLIETMGLRVAAELSPTEHALMFPGAPAGPGLLILQANAQAPEHNGAIVVRVSDVAAVVARAVALGATVVRPAQAGPQPGSSYAMFNDYDGTLIQVTQFPESLRQAAH